MGRSAKVEAWKARSRPKVAKSSLVAHRAMPIPSKAAKSTTARGAWGFAGPLQGHRLPPQVLSSCLGWATWVPQPPEAAFDVVRGRLGLYAHQDSVCFQAIYGAADGGVVPGSGA